jgi:MoaA/NifB/PqqE/SkfB family radical SAM enzyme
MSRDIEVVNDSAKNRSPTTRGVLWLGLKCDVQCKFCYDQWINPADKVWLPYADVIATLDKFRHYYQNDSVDFMGGEPTLHPRILDIVRHASRIGLRPTIITHGMHLAERERAELYAEAGIYDFLVSIHGIGSLARELHGRGNLNFERQMKALDNMQQLEIPFRFNCVLIKDNLTHLEQIADLAAVKGARVVNFLMFNPYFEWTADREIEFQVRHSQIAPYLSRALDRCTELGVEANVRYMPICSLPGHERHVYTGYQLPYDPHEWDYNSWYDVGAAGRQPKAWYLQASERQRLRHRYVHVAACENCAVKSICDGFHSQYVERWGGEEARPYLGEIVTDPLHFIQSQRKHSYRADTQGAEHVIEEHLRSPLATTQFSTVESNRAGIRPGLPRTRAKLVD